MRNYIEFYYDEEDNYIAKIHKDGKVCKVTNKNTVKVLKELLAKKKIYLYNQEGKVDNVDDVIADFDKYMTMLKKMKKVTKPLRIFNKISKDMKVTKKNPLIGKALVASSLAAVIGMTSLGIVNANKNDVDTNLVPQEVLVYVDENKEDVISNDVSIDENIPNEDTSEEEVLEEDIDLSQMINEYSNVDEFHITYEDRSNFSTIDKARRYEDIFEKYARIYGLDKELLLVIGAHENYGNHYENLHSGGSTGIMKIENVNYNTTIRAYNFETGEMDSLYLTKKKLEDLDFNIRAAAAILRSKLDSYDNNIPLAIQSYNYGAGNMSKVLNMCNKYDNMSKEEIYANPLYQGWMQYRARAVENGEPEYVERIFSYLPSGYEINVKSRNGDTIKLKVVNDLVNYNQMT